MIHGMHDSIPTTMSLVLGTVCREPSSGGRCPRGSAKHNGLRSLSWASIGAFLAWRKWWPLETDTLLMPDVTLLHYLKLSCSSDNPFVPTVPRKQVSVVDFGLTPGGHEKDDCKNNAWLGIWRGVGVTQTDGQNGSIYVWEVPETIARSDNGARVV